MRIVDRDRHDSPVPGLYNLCYLTAFQAQQEETGWWRAHHRSLLLYDRGGRPVIDTQWGEQLLDTSTAGKRTALARILGSWIDGCARAGFQAVDPDNLDSWQRSHGLLSRGENLDLARRLIRHAHADGLAIDQKNVPELGGAGRSLGFDFVVSEECQIYDECGGLRRAYGREILEVEYTRAGFAAACRARGDAVSVELRDLDLAPAGQPGHIERWCSKARL